MKHQHLTDAQQRRLDKAVEDHEAAQELEGQRVAAFAQRNKSIVTAFKRGVKQATLMRALNISRARIHKVLFDAGLTKAQVEAAEAAASNPSDDG